MLSDYLSEIFDKIEPEYTVESEIRRVVERFRSNSKWLGIGISSADYTLIEPEEWHLFKGIRVVVQPNIPKGHFYFQVRASNSETESFMYCTFLDRPRSFGFRAIECGDPECRIENIHRV